MVNNSTPVLGSAPVATNTIPAAEAIAGCMVMIVVVVAVGTPTVRSWQLFDWSGGKPQELQKLKRWHVKSMSWHPRWCVKHST